MLRDTQAAIDAVSDVRPGRHHRFSASAAASPTPPRPKLSGTVARRSAITAAAVVRFADDKPKVPTQLHFGGKTTHGIPLSDVDIIRAKRPDVEIHVYPGAQHGFSCDERPSYDKASADVAWQRGLAFFAKHMKK